MPRCPQCGQEVANFTNHRHAHVANYVPVGPLAIFYLVRKLYRKLKRQPEPMSVIYRKPPVR